MYDIISILLRRIDWRSERGQVTTEYALVLLAAALVGLLVIAWATQPAVAPQRSADCSTG